MRSGQIFIGGQPFPVKGLSVSQSLTESILYAETNAEKKGMELAKARADWRIRRVAIALQNAKSFIPDPENPTGQLLSTDKTLDEMVKILDSGIFADLTEWNKAETAVFALDGPPVEEKNPIDGEKAKGELLPTA